VEHRRADEQHVTTACEKDQRLSEQARPVPVRLKARRQGLLVVVHLHHRLGLRLVELEVSSGRTWKIVQSSPAGVADNTTKPRLAVARPEAAYDGEPITRRGR
jgi:hypothetical protein